MSMKAFNEAGAGAGAVDGAHGRHRPPLRRRRGERQAADDHLGLMTPVIKGVLTDQGFDNAVKAQQVFGGHGYIEEWGMSQFVRDARIAMIYEGANGIQAMDLVGRKLGQGRRPRRDGLLQRGRRLLPGERRRRGDEALRGPAPAGARPPAAGDMWFMQNAMAKPDNAGAGAYDYMHLFGLVAMGYMWAKIAKAAQARKAQGNGAAEKMDAKLMTGRFFMERMLPETGAHLARISAGADAVMALPAEAF